MGVAREETDQVADGLDVQQLFALDHEGCSECGRYVDPLSRQGFRQLQLPSGVLISQLFFVPAVYSAHLPNRRESLFLR